MARTDRRPRQRLGPEQRRAAILDAARGAFAHAPYEQVTLAAVADAAGASEALVHKYFATKGSLYIEIVRGAIDTLIQRQRDAADALGPGATPQQRLARFTEVYLDFAASAPEAWAAPLRSPHDGFPEAARLRAQARAHYVMLLYNVLNLPACQPFDYALHGYLGFLDAACRAWVTAGCPPDQRPVLTAMARAALNGALSATAPDPASSPQAGTHGTHESQQHSRQEHSSEQPVRARHH